jgi:hypothetical protein
MLSRPWEAAIEHERCNEDQQSGILRYLKDNGERLDIELAVEMGTQLETIRRCLSDLSAKGDVIMCHAIRYIDGKKIEGTLCRASGYSPPPSRGRKPNARSSQE